MENTKYRSKVWATKALSEKAEEQIEAIIFALLPENYDIKITKGDFENPDNKFQAHFRYKAELIPTTDSPHWVVFAYSEAGVKARVLVELLDGRPVFPLT